MVPSKYAEPSAIAPVSIEAPPITHVPEFDDAALLPEELSANKPSRYYFSLEPSKEYTPWCHSSALHDV